MPSHAARLLLVLASAASLSACSNDPEPEPTPTPPPDTTPYDGPWTPLGESGDWTDPGPLAACSAGATECGSPSSFNMSGCDTGSLDTLERQNAIYRAEIRYEVPNNTGGVTPAPSSGGFQLDNNGQPRIVLGLTPSNSLVGPGAFFASAEQPRNNINLDRWTFAGCQATGPRTLTGCIAWCRNGQLRFRGTFRAERMAWRPGETESQGLQLVSESRVQLGLPVDVYVTKGHAYVVSIPNNVRPGGLTVFNVSDPAQPVQGVSVTRPNDSYWNGVWAKDDALYIASGDTGVLVYDITNPAQPTFALRANTGTAGALDVHTVFVEGNRLYAMSPSARQTFVFDVSTPLKPQLLASYAHPSVTTGYPHDAFAYGGRLYVNHTVDGFLVVDLDAASPTLLGQYTYPYTYSHANAVGTFNGRTIAFEGGERLGAHLRVLDVTDPGSIAKIGEYKLRGVTSIHNMVLAGTRLYVAHYHEGVRVIDVADPSQPREVAYFNSFRETDLGRGDGMYEGAIGMRVPGDGHLYVVDTARGLLILDEP
ncbi:LVIVD repeat-containing protein [Pyxidicoccus sp. 3LFB2]